jgi:DNA-binding winged helix-turn-helix (wHTH) protein
LVTYGFARRMHARFDCFQVDLSSNELFRSGVRVPIQEQPLQILRLLLEAEGRVVTREQLRSALWPKDTFVDFEHGVNTAVKKLRRALQDSAESPRFVETLTKVGYRFMVNVEWSAEGIGSNPHPQVIAIAPPGLIAVPSPAPNRKALEAGSRGRLVYLGMGLLLLAAVGTFLLRPRRHIQRGNLMVIPFTTFPGFEIAPSFSPDGNEIVFSWFGYEKEFQFDLYIKQVGQEHVVGRARSLRRLHQHMARRVLARREISRLGLCAHRGRRQSLFAIPGWKGGPRAEGCKVFRRLLRPRLG